MLMNCTGALVKPKGHYQIFMESPPHLECCLVNVFGSDRYLPISRLEVDLAEHLGITLASQTFPQGGVEDTCS